MSGSSIELQVEPWWGPDRRREELAEALEDMYRCAKDDWSPDLVVPGIHYDIPEDEDYWLMVVECLECGACRQYRNVSDLPVEDVYCPDCERLLVCFVPVDPSLEDL